MRSESDHIAPYLDLFQVHFNPLSLSFISACGESPFLDFLKLLQTLSRQGLSLGLVRVICQH
jgi:hypothetical protein